MSYLMILRKEITRVDADAQFQSFTGPMADVERADLGQEVQGQGGDLGRVMVPVADRQPAGHHVGVTDGFHLVGVVVLQNRVEQRVQFIQQTNHLQVKRPFIHSFFYSIRCFASPTGGT